MLARVFFATLFAVTATSISASDTANSTEVREAVRLCDQNPNCGYGNPDAGGGMLLTVIDGDNTTIIDCPPKGDCTIVRRTGKRKVTGKKANEVVVALKKRPAVVAPGRPAGVAAPN